MTIFYATLANRFCGVLFSLMWAVMIERHSIRTSYLGVCSLMIVAIGLCAALESAWQYWILALLLSCTGTGGFSIGRSLIASLAPPGKVTEVYGFASFAGQVAGLSGPFLFALVAQLTGVPRIGFLIAFIFMLTGMATFLSIPASEFERSGLKIGNDQDDSNKNFSYGTVPTSPKDEIEKETSDSIPEDPPPVEA